VEEEKRIRETPQQSAANLLVNEGKMKWIAGYALYCCGNGRAKTPP